MLAPAQAVCIILAIAAEMLAQVSVSRASWRRPELPGSSTISMIE